ncbi:MAG: tetratricopeptide repeat protein [Candidatus Levybacteria bacterium]|nr:tetratricopeptide repeat protein [Candidatus Levybacteria bacterium]
MKKNSAKKSKQPKIIPLHPAFIRPHFPNISRFFPDKPFISLKRHIKITVISVFSLVILGVILFALMDTYVILQKRHEIQLEREQIQKELIFWDSFLKSHQDYRDGYFRMAQLYYRLGNYQMAKELLVKVFLIDPNFSEGRVLEKILNKTM